MNILVSSNKKFLKPLFVMLFSLCSNTKEQYVHVFFINVSLNVVDIQKESFNLKKNRNIDLDIINIPQDSLLGLKIFGHFSIETYSRLFLLKVLPKNLDKILWLDADIIIHNPIDDFYNMDFDGKAAIVCKSINQKDDEVRHNLNLNEHQDYFNAGVILFNLRYLRDNFDSDFFIKYAINNKDKLKWLDQDVLNATIGGIAKIIDYKKYNYMHYNNSSFNQEVLKYIEMENCILHYLGPIKPWNLKYNSQTFKYWFKYAKASKIYSNAFLLSLIFKKKTYNILKTIYRKIFKNGKKR
jgi:lipopolysaccharide biosynthesis glycosyltransferase